VVVSIPDGASCQFDPEIRAVGAARRFAFEIARQWGAAPHDIVLVVSELAANAVVHGHTPFTVSLSRHGRTVSIEVFDEHAGPARRSTVSTEAQSGRGLVIVDRVATNWGSRPLSEGGKVVWAELDD
jgi:anti-sigma regulatory factor (Ser/Thr protein kinase)